MSKKIYVGNLPFTSTEEDLRGVFERHGSVDSVVLSEFAYDRDIFELMPDEVWDTQVLLTMMNGDIVFRIEDDEEGEQDYEEFDDLEFGGDE